MAAMYRKHFTPLESDPFIFTSLIRSLGAPSSLAFEDVYSLDKPQVPPHPALALILVFPTSEKCEKQTMLEDSKRSEYVDGGENDDIIWFKQTINNACGNYGSIIVQARCQPHEDNVNKWLFFEDNSEERLIKENMRVPILHVKDCK
ncbi:uncharacterized protein F4822DRAFT_236270 [Hypoxylon trugodes]|uniref:uncharacterized protein n=1 Tax=Hypoxylon trugodes TaxID=326681 RepID=UPI00219CA949|nr:uncharacterized protein F4822DRAFT_236270 [Hypoxylon trugodes]KAI1382509.1 hypothetical protein F4822DRAFT_236270 [Hypoxylon trugodes]